MGKHFSLTAADKHSLGAYRADPSGTPKGGIVVVQEIFSMGSPPRSAITAALSPSSPMRSPNVRCNCISAIRISRSR